MTNKFQYLLKPHRYAIVILLSCTMIAQADELDMDADDSVGERCVSTRSIRNTSVLDDRNILFEMRNKDLYLNLLASACTGLSRDGQFGYESFGSRLCQNDTIYMLVERGRGLERGRMCRLGAFTLVTQDELDAMEDRAAKPLEPRAPQGPEPEEVISEPADDATSDDETG